MKRVYLVRDSGERVAADLDKDGYVWVLSPKQCPGSNFRNAVSPGQLEALGFRIEAVPEPMVFATYATVAATNGDAGNGSVMFVIVENKDRKGCAFQSAGIQIGTRGKLTFTESADLSEQLSRALLQATVAHELRTRNPRGEVSELVREMLRELQSSLFDQQALAIALRNSQQGRHINALIESAYIEEMQRVELHKRKLDEFKVRATPTGSAQGESPEPSCSDPGCWCHLDPNAPDGAKGSG